jgi:NNP family nitrate/nitrite transporter-like MFS transporter
VGGLVGSLGALGGFFLPPLFAYTTAWTGMPQSTFFVIFVVTLIGANWMHVTVVTVLHHASPELANKFEHEHAYEQGDRTLDQREMTGV